MNSSCVSKMQLLWEIRSMTSCSCKTFFRAINCLVILHSDLIPLIEIILTILEISLLVFFSCRKLKTRKKKHLQPNKLTKLTA